MSDLPVSPGPGDIRLQRRLILDLLPLRRLRWSGNFDINHFDHFRHFHSCLTMCGIPFLGQACRVLSGACNPMLCPMCVFRTLRREQPVLAPGRARMPAVLRAVHWEQWPDMRAAYRLSTHTQPPSRPATQPPSHPATHADRPPATTSCGDEGRGDDSNYGQITERKNKEPSVPCFALCLSLFFIQNTLFSILSTAQL